MFTDIHIRDFRVLQDRNITLGKYITMLAGWNATGKSTILALLANSTELKKIKTYTGKNFQAEFGEILKGSKEFDKTQSDRVEISCCLDGQISTKKFRTTWQKVNNRERFRVIPYEKTDKDVVSEAKFPLPVIYLGLSRLYPIGETDDNLLSDKEQTFYCVDDKEWYEEHYKDILSIFDEEIKSITDVEFKSANQKDTYGINTSSYDWRTNSAGQYNLSQILFAVLSFKKLHKDYPDVKGGLLLIDEIEATLHPLAQRKLIDLFIKEAKQSNFQVVFTTHSVSLMEYFADKKRSEDRNVAYYYFTIRNKKLLVEAAPTYENMRKDILREELVQSSINKIFVYTEDDEAKWFLNYCLSAELKKCIKIVSMKLSNSKIIDILNSNLNLVDNCMFVLDGDVSNKCMKKIKKGKRSMCLRLPTSHYIDEEPPEKSLFHFLDLLTNSSKEYFDAASKINVNINYEYFKEHSPKNATGEKDRDKYKNWFNMHKSVFTKTRIMQFWKKENREQVEIFNKNFKSCFNQLAENLGMEPIK